MFGSSALEVGIGLVFVYLLLSLVCAAVNELIAAISQWRAVNLREGIRFLLNDPSLEKAFREHPLISSLRQEHPLLMKKSHDKLNTSYIPAQNFSLALMDLILSDKDGRRPDTVAGLRAAVQKAADGNGRVKINDDLRRLLYVLIDEAENSLAESQAVKLSEKQVRTALGHLRAGIEGWFNSSMERVSGWYKRKMQLLTIGVAVALVLMLNVDTVTIARALMSSSTLRATLVAEAEKVAQQSGAPEAGRDFATIRDQVGQLQEFGLPLGWNAELQKINEQKSVPGTTWWLFWTLSKLFGLTLTAGAASLGAPFWFDTLRKIITIRSAGKSPAEAAPAQS